MIEICFFAAGIAIGAIVTARIVGRRARRLIHMRGEALREITNYKWDTGENDAMVITRIALHGLEHQHKRMNK